MQIPLQFLSLKQYFKTSVNKKFKLVLYGNLTLRNKYKYTKNKSVNKAAVIKNIVDTPWLPPLATNAAFIHPLKERKRKKIWFKKKIFFRTREKYIFNNLSD